MSPLLDAPDDPFLALMRALRRSRVRVEILLVLLEHGRLALSDLARIVGADRNNVFWAIWGDNEQDPRRKRYRIDQCLVVLGLVDLVEVDDAKVYELTPLGTALARRLLLDVDRRRGPRPRVRT